MPMHKPTNGPLYIRALRTYVEVTHACDDHDEANAFMAANPGYGVIDTLGPLVLLARMDDKGIKQLPADPGALPLLYPRMSASCMRQALEARGVDFTVDYHALPRDAVLALIHAIQATGYRPPGNAPGSPSLMLFQSIQRRTRV